jgi:Cu/Ag efflux protein CusF
METMMSVQNVWPGIAAAAALSLAVSALPAALPRPAAAQGGNPTMTNVIPEAVAATIHAKIQKIDPQSRQVTLTGPSGHTVTLTAGEAVRLDMLKPGDTVNAKYYRSVAFVLSPSMDAPPNEVAQVTAQPVQAPGGVGVRLTRVSGLVVGIQLAANSIDVVNPSGGGVYTLHVTDPARIALLGTLKVGDTVTAVVSEALAVSIEPAPKNWFNWL